MYERYKKPIMITENGLSNKDWISMDGKVHDEGRIDFLRRYLGRLNDSIDDGINVTGYFQWSLLDNFEWQKDIKIDLDLSMLILKQEKEQRKNHIIGTEI